jgi:beta-mannosidase
MERHQKNDSGNQLMVAQMLDTFRLPKDFESMVYLSMVLQAEGIRYGVEHWRRYPKRVSGIIYWQLNDCWPVASWSSLDYFLRWKALHYAARKFYAPVLMSIEDKPTSQTVYVTNETRDTITGTIRWTLQTLNGNVVTSGEEKVKVAPFDATMICSRDFSENLIGDRQRDLAFTAELIQDGEITSRQVAYFVPTKHLNLANPEISTKLYANGDQFTIELASRSLARLVECSLEGADVVFSDNYFDLPVGSTIKVTAPIPSGWTIAQVQKALKVQSIYDSFAH